MEPSAPPSDHRPIRGALATMMQGFSPTTHGASFGVGTGVKPALIFALLLTLPLIWLSGIIPYTHHVHFGSAMHVQVDAGLATKWLVLDVLRAMGLSTLVLGLSYALFGASFVSLAKAFSRPGDEEAQPPEHVPSVWPPSRAAAGRAALRAVLYRSWLVPMQGLYGLPAMTLFWVLPSGSETLALVVTAIPLVLLMMNFQAAARQSCACSLGGAMVATIIPIVLMLFCQAILIGDPPGKGVLAPWMPEPQEAPVDEGPSEPAEREPDYDAATHA